MLERDTGIKSMTVARFLRQHGPLLSSRDPLKLAAARKEMRGTVVFLDEASMVGNGDKEKLVQISNLLQLERFASIGDRKQLGAVDAGKPFDLMQKAGTETAIMNLNIRARDKRLCVTAGFGGSSSIDPCAHLNGKLPIRRAVGQSTLGVQAQKAHLAIVARRGGVGALRERCGRGGTVGKPQIGARSECQCRRTAGKPHDPAKGSGHIIPEGEVCIDRDHRENRVRICAAGADIADRCGQQHIIAGRS
jgi:hypothetical protein